MSLSRASKSEFTEWWWTVDRVTLFVVLALIAIGLMLAFAASPAATGGSMSAGNFRYAGRQLGFAIAALAIFGVASMLSLRSVKIAAAAIFVLALIGCVIARFSGAEILGARRWIDFGWFTLQPSEFLKPGFAVLAAAILADRAKMVLPKPAITALLVAPAVLILLLQPDVGQTGLLLALWGALLFFYGIAAKWIAALSGTGIAFAVSSYFLFGHVQHRVLQFFGGDQTGDQVKLSLRAFARGGFLGVGPGAGSVKYKIPYANSDFIFAVAGEEFGFVLCGLIALLFCTLSVRLLIRSAQARDPFAQIAGAALAVVIALQAFMNMAVTINLMPATGMTLPFISYGGSSLLAVALTLGFAVALTRQRSKIGERDHDVFVFLREARA